MVPLGYLVHIRGGESVEGLELRRLSKLPKRNINMTLAGIARENPRTCLALKVHRKSPTPLI